MEITICAARPEDAETPGCDIQMVCGRYCLELRICSTHGGGVSRQDKSFDEVIGDFGL